jgi:predicted transcriptional regulator
MTTAEVKLAAQLDAIATAIEQARSFEHEHGLSNRHTRKLPADTLRSLRRWQHTTEDAACRVTLHSNVAATAPATGSQRQAVTPSPPAKGAPTVPVSPTVGIRIPEPLRQRAEDLAHREERSFGQVVRRALTEHVERVDNHHTNTSAEEQ